MGLLRETGTRWENTTLALFSQQGIHFPQVSDRKKPETKDSPSKKRHLGLFLYEYLGEEYPEVLGDGLSWSVSGHAETGEVTPRKREM